MHKVSITVVYKKQKEEKEKKVVPGAVVVLLSRNLHILRVAVADNQGRCEFANVASGLYVLRTEVPGHPNTRFEMISVEATDSPFEVFLKGHDPGTTKMIVTVKVGSSTGPTRADVIVNVYVAATNILVASSVTNGQGKVDFDLEGVFDLEALGNGGPHCRGLRADIVLAGSQTPADVDVYLPPSC